ncbi:uncharacterized protein LOC142559839 [Dermacentor variabilis]|uniref:uncharacterized protein LOC142559839 n=1 Tax=Dermacentor variabilis TaxID=34621 RepID=UPI003F5BBEE7
MAAWAPLRLLIAFAAASAVLRQAEATEVGGFYRPEAGADYYGAAPDRADVDDVPPPPPGSALAMRGRLAREGAGRPRAPPMAAVQPRCREDAYLELRSMCERNLDEIMRLYTKGDHAQSCQRLHQYTSCVGKALNRTRCHRLADLAMRERQRMRSNVNDYNWSCSTSSSRQEYAGGAAGNCDGKELINHHMRCGSTFQNFVGSINVYKEQAKACRAVRDYKDCVKPIFQNEDCHGNQELMDRLLRFSHTVLKEYSSACAEQQQRRGGVGGGEYQDAPGGGGSGGGIGYDDDDGGVGTGFCRFEQLRQKTLQCQREGYSVIRTRDAHAKADICEELKVFKDCAVAALKATHCSKEKNARQHVIGAVRESFQRFGIECTGLWNAAASTHSAATPGAAARALLAVSLTLALLGRAPP